MPRINLALDTTRSARDRWETVKRNYEADMKRAGDPARRAELKEDHEAAIEYFTRLIAKETGREPWSIHL